MCFCVIGFFVNAEVGGLIGCWVWVGWLLVIYGVVCGLVFAGCYRFVCG